MGVMRQSSSQRACRERKFPSRGWAFELIKCVGEVGGSTQSINKSHCGTRLMCVNAMERSKVAQKLSRSHTLALLSQQTSRQVDHLPAFFMGDTFVLH